jgi:hypothetical protein
MRPLERTYTAVYVRGGEGGEGRRGRGDPCMVFQAREPPTVRGTPRGLYTEPLNQVRVMVHKREFLTHNADNLLGSAEINLQVCLLN